MRVDAVRVRKVEGLTVKIYPDPEPSNPRENDNLGTMVCWHRRYNLGDEGQGWGTTHRFMNGTETRSHAMFSEPSDYIDARKEWNQRYMDAWGTRKPNPSYDPVVIELPLWLYDHSGITMWAGSRDGGKPGSNCPWDSGQVGWIYVQRSKLYSEYGVTRITKEVLARAETCLRAEVEEYDQYLTGDVYGYVVEAPSDDDDEGEDGEELDSCWGFFGLDYATEEGVSAAKAELAYRERQRQETMEAHDGA